MNQVRIVLSKNVYDPGEEVAFDITNGSLETIFYTFGCTRPVVLKVGDEVVVALTVDISESIPDLTPLPAADTSSCRWDQRAWQDPSREGSDRLLHYIELANVPAGEYRLRLDYWLDEADVDEGEKANTAHSTVFTIR